MCNCCALFLSVNDLDKDQVFTGMAYDPYSGMVFLSSPKVSGRRAAISFFNVNKYQPGSVPMLMPFPKFTKEAKVSKRGDNGELIIDYDQSSFPTV